MDSPEQRRQPSELPRPRAAGPRGDGIRVERRSAPGRQPTPSSHHQRRASDVIRTCRESTGLDRAVFAAEVGVPEHILALWEDPTYEGVDLAILRRVARAAGGELELRFRPASEANRAAG